MKRHEIWLVLNILKGLYLHFFPGAKFLSHEKILKSLNRPDQVRYLKDLKFAIGRGKTISEYIELIRTDINVAIKLYFVMNSIDFFHESEKMRKPAYYIIEFSASKVNMFPAVFPIKGPKYPVVSFSENDWKYMCNTNETEVNVTTKHGEETILIGKASLNFP